MKKFALFSIISLSILLVAASDSYACRCGGSSPDTPLKQLVEDAKAQAGAVFVGKVVSIRITSKDSPATTKSPDLARLAPKFIKLIVVRSWKGVAADEIEISTATNSGMCGVEFEVGKEYLVYAHLGETDTMRAHRCSRTQMIRAKSDDERHLGKRLSVVRYKRS